MRDTRDLVLDIVGGEFKGDVQCALADLRERSPKAYLDAVAKLMPYALPRMEAVQTTEAKPSLSWTVSSGSELQWFDQETTTNN